jgi:hypothetical protein
MGNVFRATGVTLLAAWPVLICSSKVDVLRLVPQAVAALGKVAAPTPRQDYEPTLRLLCSDNNLVQFGHLLFRQVASEEGGRLPAGGTVLEGLDFGQTEARPFGVGDELQLLQHRRHNAGGRLRVVPTARVRSFRSNVKSTAGLRPYERSP